jgi:hypothetical protein
MMMNKLHTLAEYLKESGKDDNKTDEKEKIRKRWMATKTQILKQKNGALQSLKKSVTTKLKDIGNNADASFIKTELKDAIDDTVDAYDTRMDKEEKKYHKELRDHDFKKKTSKKVYAAVLAGTVAGYAGYQTYKHYKKKKKAVEEVDREDKNKVKKLHEIYCLEMLNRRLDMVLLNEITNTGIRPIKPSITPMTGTGKQVTTPGVKAAVNTSLKLEDANRKLDVSQKLAGPGGMVANPAIKNLKQRRDLIKNKMNNIKNAASTTVTGKALPISTTTPTISPKV